MHDQLTIRLEGIQAVLMAHHRAGARLPSAAKGDERELLVREFLERVFPAPYRFGSGAVTDANGAISGQLDIVVEWPFFASFPTPGGSQRLYLADSVAFVIEVKSDLVSQWQQVERSVAKLRRLRRRWLSHSGVGTQAKIASVGPSTSRIPFVAVGFAGHKTLDGLRKCVEDTPEDKRPDAALVIESGAYVGCLGQTWPRQTLLVKSRQSISTAMGVRFTGGMASISLAFKRRMQDRCSARF